jgi:hypothetical protein
MTVYATHRFSVGQRVTRLAEASTSCEVLALVGADGPEYRIKPERGAETVVAERDLSYASGSTWVGRPRLSLH